MEKRRRALAIDWDGTLANTWTGYMWLRRVKLFFFKYLKPIYILGELAEFLVKPRYELHDGAAELIAWARGNGMLVGIATDRNLLGLAMAAKLAKFDLGTLDFIHVRARFFDRFVSWPEGPAMLWSDRYKGEAGAFNPLVLFLASNGIVNPEDVLVVGDDDRDVAAAMQNGFAALKVDRYSPDFSKAYEHFRQTAPP